MPPGSFADAGWLDGMVEQYEEARQHNVLHSVLRSDDRWDSLQASARYLLIVCSLLVADMPASLWYAGPF